MNLVIDFLRTNAQWLFSGIGVRALTAVGAGVRALWLRVKGRKTTASRAPGTLPEAESQLSAAPPAGSWEVASGGGAKTLEQVGRELAAIPIMLRDEALKHYRGVRVVAEGRLGSLQRQDDGRIRIGIIGKNSMYAYMDVAPSEYPGIGLLRDGIQVRLEGEIERFLLDSYPLLHNGKATFESVGDAVV